MHLYQTAFLRRRLLIATFFALPLSLRAPAAARDAATTVPFTLRGVHIYVQATINGQPATLVLDTGAGADIFTPEAAKRLKLSLEGDAFSARGAAGSVGGMHRVSGLSIAVGNAQTDRQVAFVIALPEEMDADGMLGTPFFEKRIVTIDYARRQLTISPREGFKPPEGAATFRLTFLGNTPHVKAVADGVEGLFQVDTGAGDSVTLNAPFVEKNHLRGKYTPAIRTATGLGIGGFTFGDIVRIPKFQMGPFEFANPVTELSTATDGVFSEKTIAGNLGGELLSRFTLTFDYERKMVYMVKNDLYDKPFIGNRSGLGVSLQGGKHVVRFLIPASPGAEAGIQVGDVVLEVDGTPAEKVAPWELSQWMRREPGTRIRLKLLGTDGKVREATVVLRDLI